MQKTYNLLKWPKRTWIALHINVWEWETNQCLRSFLIIPEEAQDVGESNAMAFHSKEKSENRFFSFPDISRHFPTLPTFPDCRDLSGQVGTAPGGGPKCVVMCWNVWSVLNESKLDNLLQILEDFNVSVACITETWFDAEKGTFSGKIKNRGYDIQHAYSWYRCWSWCCGWCWE